jgi:hypothetical protein
MFDPERLLKNSGPRDLGVFMLEKCIFVVEGDTVGVGQSERCDNISFTGVFPTNDTPYESHSQSLYVPTIVSDAIIDVTQVVKFEHPIAVVPHFYIRYLELNNLFDIESDPTPSTMWVAKSIFQLFKNIREWSFLVEEPFNSDHPMATYSKLVFDILNPPQEIIDEIDALPDMHLAMFLKGNPNYKKIPYPYPEVSEAFKAWVLQLSVDYPEKSFEDTLEELF